MGQVPGSWVGADEDSPHVGRVEFEALIVIQVDVWSGQWTLEPGFESSRWEMHSLTCSISLFGCRLLGETLVANTVSSRRCSGCLLCMWAGVARLRLCFHRDHLLLGLDTSSRAMFSEQAAQRAHTLLCPPSASNATFARGPVVTYTNSSQPFRLGERSFSRQYAHIYATRLIQMRPFLVSRAQQHWGK